MKNTNPFSLTYNPEYFCDRAEETIRLKDNIINDLNTLLHSPRRLGKTSLIFHLFEELEKSKKYDTIYIDLFASGKLEDLIRILSTKILEKYYRKNFIQGVSSLLKGINPTITFSNEGNYELSLNINEKQQESTLDKLFKYLEKRNNHVIIAFDEFQEVANYPEKTEALLRSYIQGLKNINFIFSGSSSHLLQGMFFTAKKPFYQSAEVLVLNKIQRKEYYQFILNTFSKNLKTITPEAVDYILDFTDGYTYYTQIICNQCYYRTEKELNVEKAGQIISDYLDNRKVDYQSILNLLPDNQKRLAIAIAKKKVVKQPTSIDFIMKYKLPSASSTFQAVRVLEEKEIIYKSDEGFLVYDVFFGRFLEKYY